MSGAKWIVGSAVLVLAGAGAGASLVGVSSAAGTGAAHAAKAPSPPATLKAGLIMREEGTLAPGTTVRSTDIGHRVFVGPRYGFALASMPEAQYPARTTDGGAVWKTFGPALHINAAHAPLSVTEVGATDRRTVYYYGSGQVVDVTSDGGKRWYGTLTSELSLAVVPGASGRLVWITQGANGNDGTHAVTSVYYSHDGGKLWHYTTALGGGF